MRINSEVRGNPRRARRAGGFSLVEVVVVLSMISLAVGALAPLAVRQITGNRQLKTLEKMKRVEAGLVGDPLRGDFGYLGDMGGLPAALADLNTRGTQPLYAIDANYGIGAGYNGPYVPLAGPAGSAFVDSWSMAFQYAPTSAQLTSAGPDRTLGTADDIVYPQTPPALSGDVTVDVKGIPSGGGAQPTLTSAEVSVFIASVANGVRTESQIGGSGPFVSTNLPLGYHGLRVIGNAGGAYSGASAREVIEVRRGSNAVEVALEEP
jgi:type II secretory pathway pseudopilin PulG